MEKLLNILMKNFLEFINEWETVEGRFIRCILESDMTTLFQLTKDPDNFNTRKRQFAIDDRSIKTLEIIPQPRSKYGRLMVKSNTSGANGKEYQVRIQFENSPVLKEPDSESIPIKVKSGKEHHIHPIQLDKHDVKVTCTCPDFRWRFAWQNNVDGSLLGAKPKPYKKKTNRPPVNPNDVPGVCKHIIKVVQALDHAGVVKQ